MRAKGAVLTLGLALLAGPLTAQPSGGDARLAHTIEAQALGLVEFAREREDLCFAEAELRLALEVLPGSTALGEALATVEREVARAEADSTLIRAFSSAHMRLLAAEQARVHEAISLALARAASEADDEARARYLQGILRCYPSEAANAFLDMEYFEPLRRWVPRADLAVLREGGDYHEGELLSPASVAALNSRHASWKDPWVFSDEVHELRTTVPLRQAKQLLVFLGAYRAFFLARFGDAWDLRTPSGKLPVIVTRTQAELQDQLRRAARERGVPTGGQERELGVAFYLHTGGTLDPCFATYEPKDTAGNVFTIPWDEPEQLELALAHELTHQIAFEYSKHAARRSRPVRYQYWAVEGIASFMCQHLYERGSFILRLERQLRWGERVAEPPFAYCKRTLASLPTLRAFVGRSRAQCLNAESYQMGATLAYFLLEGEDGKYRGRFVKLLQTVHRQFDTRDSFDKAFAGVEPDTLQAEWERFVAGLPLR
ncbi:MAG: hypothetical protein KDD82_07595 [Planctomycetes bacterium]|nr:hypothetical protein [Planctomycetota bacterium]